MSVDDSMMQMNFSKTLSQQRVPGGTKGAVCPASKLRGGTEDML